MVDTRLVEILTLEAKKGFQPREKKGWASFTRTSDGVHSDNHPIKRVSSCCGWQQWNRWLQDFIALWSFGKLCSLPIRLIVSFSYPFIPLSQGGVPLRVLLILTLTFFVSRLSSQKGRSLIMRFLWIHAQGLPHHNALSTHGTPLGCRCPGSDFVPIWDPLLWLN